MFPKIFVQQLWYVCVFYMTSKLKCSFSDLTVTTGKEKSTHKMLECKSLQFIVNLDQKLLSIHQESVRQNKITVCVEWSEIQTTKYRKTFTVSDCIKIVNLAEQW